MRSSALFITGVFVASSASASDLVYTPNNPSFGGNPFNSSHLLGVANAINRYKDPSAISSSDPAAQFLRTLQSRLLSALATQITDIIFGENAQTSGLIKFGDQEIAFVRGIESVTLTISNNADGSVTEIVVPVLQAP
jgi:curli production assembly/transport component CsgF